MQCFNCLLIRKTKFSSIDWLYKTIMKYLFTEVNQLLPLKCHENIK